MSTAEAELISSGEAAEILKQTVRNVARLADAGKLRPVKKLPGPRGAYIFSREDVQALAAAKAS